MEKQSERKNNRSKAVIIVIAMLLMVALVVGMGAMTYSRYITSDTTGDQTATAAKWGFVVTVNADNLFGTDYTLETGSSLATKVTSDGVGVAVNAESSVVAPGTTGSMTISITGSAEVLAKLTIDFGNTVQEIHYGDYYPVEWTLSEGNTKKVVGKLSDVVDYFNNDSNNPKITAGDDTFEREYTLTWEWELGSDDDTNAKDTIIGYKASGKAYNEIENSYIGTKKLGDLVSSDNYNTESAFIVTQMSFNMTVSIEQIQE